MYLELLVSPVVLHTLGTSVFIPYRAAYKADGSPLESQYTLSSIQYTYPGQIIILAGKRNLNFDLVHNYEVSPYNYGLYIETLLSTLNGSYTITLDGKLYIFFVCCYFNIGERHHWLHSTVLEKSNHGNVL